MDLLKYKKYEPIYVIGHSNIDIDSAVASKILCDLFNDFGVKAYYAVLDKKYDFDSYNQKMIDACMEFKPKVIKKKDVNKYNWFLVDHNDKLQSVGMDANVIASIDHHPNCNQIEDITITDICSTALFIYNEFKDKYEFSKEQKYQIFMAFLNDATFGKASRYKESDGLIADTLGFGHDYKKLFKKFFIPTDISAGVKESIYNGHKKYQFDDVYFESGYIERFDTKGLKEYKEAINEKDAFLGLWLDYTKEITYVYFKYDDKLKEIVYNFIASRATTVLNDILKYLKENNYLKGE